MDALAEAKQPAQLDDLQDFVAGPFLKSLGLGSEGLTDSDEQTSETSTFCRGLPRERPSPPSGS